MKNMGEVQGNTLSLILVWVWVKSAGLTGTQVTWSLSGSNIISLNSRGQFWGNLVSKSSYILQWNTQKTRWSMSVKKNEKRINLVIRHWHYLRNGMLVMTGDLSALCVSDRFPYNVAKFRSQLVKLFVRFVQQQPFSLINKKIKNKMVNATCRTRIKGEGLP